MVIPPSIWCTQEGWYVNHVHLSVFIELFFFRVSIFESVFSFKSSSHFATLRSSISYVNMTYLLIKAKPLLDFAIYEWYLLYGWAFVWAKLHVLYFPIKSKRKKNKRKIQNEQEKAKVKLFSFKKRAKLIYVLHTQRLELRWLDLDMGTYAIYWMPSAAPYLSIICPKMW